MEIHIDQCMIHAQVHSYCTLYCIKFTYIKKTFYIRELEDTDIYVFVLRDSNVEWLHTEPSLRLT